jgi:hypothetical protein
MVWSAPLTMDQREAVDQAVMAQMHKQGLVGLSIGIIEEGEVAYTAGYGFANRDDKTPVDANTLYRWASISKPLTAVAAMQLVETGSLDLDADVAFSGEIDVDDVLLVVSIWGDCPQHTVSDQSIGVGSSTDVLVVLGCRSPIRYHVCIGPLPLISTSPRASNK